MTAADRDRWNAKYAERPPPSDLDPPEWLVECAASLPPGRALDLACGHGHAAIWLAQRGWSVTGLDISPVGLAEAERLAARHDVSVNWKEADVDHAFLGENEFDLITVFRFLDRETLPGRIVKALRPGGLLAYETFLLPEPSQSSPIQNAAYLLRPGELLQLFASLEPRAYEECRSATHCVARLLAFKM